MTRTILVLVMLCLATIITNAQPSRLSPQTHFFLHFIETHTNSLPESYVYRKDIGEIRVCGMVKVNSSINELQLLNLGCIIGTKAGNIWTVQVPVSHVAQFCTLSALDYVQLDEPIHPNLDQVRLVTRVDSVQDGLGGLPAPFHGKNVVVGIIDAGFDYRHPTLFDTTGLRYRVRKIWEQTNSGTPPSGFTYGNEWTDSTSMWAVGTDMQISHGAHVAGIAAGSGYGSANNKFFRGIADAADLVLVAITPSRQDWTSTGMSAIVDAMNYIYTYAASVGKPAVTNLSWGSSIGSHDGLSLFSQACDNLTGAGKIFVISAGNNGTNAIHLQKTFSPTDTLARTFLTFSSSLPKKQSWVDIWGDSTKRFCLQISLYNGSTPIDSSGYICLDNLMHNIMLKGSANDTFTASLSTSISSFNGKPRMFLDVSNGTNNSVLLSIKSSNSSIHAWTGYVQKTTGYYGSFSDNGFPWAMYGNNDYTIGDMGCTKSALTVGAFISKTSMKNVSGNTVTYITAAANGNIAGFSSRGPTADGRIKPDIAAPGMVTGSAINSYDPSYANGGSSFSDVAYQYTDPLNGRQYGYAMMMGTSMSSPAAAGIVALMLEANPTLTPAQIKSILQQTALLDNRTGAITAPGSTIWGWGKINALAAVKRAVSMTDVSTLSKSNAITLFPNPAKEECTLHVWYGQDEKSWLTISDIQGRLVSKHEIQLRAGDNYLGINTQSIPCGLYIVKLPTSSGSYVSRLLVQ
ncbi:MAG: S8 family peptidase [Bacteroidetes bacterium]|nr:S8 family peptidase [Bacteroidota bacterium]